MKDIRLPLVISIPIAIGFLGLVWYFKSKNDDSKKSKSTKKVEKASIKPVNVRSEVEKEGITMTQRKIPDRELDHTQQESMDRKCESSIKQREQNESIEIIRLEEISKNDEFLSGLKDSCSKNILKDNLNEIHSKISDINPENQIHLDISARENANELKDKVYPTHLLSNDNMETCTKTEDSSSQETSSEKSSKECDFLKSHTIKQMEATSTEESLEKSNIDSEEIVKEIMSSVSMPVCSEATNKLMEKIYPSSSLPITQIDVSEKTETSSAQGNNLEKISDESERFRSQAEPQTEATSKDVFLEKSEIEKGVSLKESDSKNAENIKEIITYTSMPVSCAINTKTDINYDVHNSFDLDRSPEVSISETMLKTTIASNNLDAPSTHGSKNETNENCDVKNVPGQSCLDNSPVEAIDLDMDNLIQPDMVSSWSDQDTSLNEKEDASEMVSSSSEILKDNLSTCSASIGIGSKEVSPTKSTSPLCDDHSVGSNDSGRGPSDHESHTQSPVSVIQFDFNMPSDLCGRFIGKQGKNINQLKQKSGANICLTHNPFTPEFQICQVSGTQAEVDEALSMIRRKFPENNYPHLTMIQVNQPPPALDNPIIIPDAMQLSLPEGVSVQVYVSAVVDAGHIFVQQPTHRSFMSLEKLNLFLSTAYSQDPNIPSVPLPLECGVICVCMNEGAWYRAMITSQEDELGECQIKFVDYGGYAQMPVSELKQIRTDFMALPFQAVECYMGNITPLQTEEFYSDAASAALCDLTAGKLLHCQVVARTETGVPHVHLYQMDPENNSAVMINRDLVNKQFVRWVELR